MSMLLIGLGTDSDENDEVTATFASFHEVAGKRGVTVSLPDGWDGAWFEMKWAKQLHEWLAEDIDEAEKNK